jgi:hypothetical protein
VNAGAWVMFFIGAIGLWGGLIFFIRHYFAAARREANAATDDQDRA